MSQPEDQEYESPEPPDRYREWVEQGLIEESAEREAAAKARSYVCDCCGKDANDLPPKNWLSRVNPGETPSIWRCQSCRKSKPMESLADIRRERDQLKRWKTDAMKLLSTIDFQAIGKELDLTIGDSVGDKILPAIKKLKGDAAELAASMIYYFAVIYDDGAPNNGGEDPLLGARERCNAAMQKFLKQSNGKEEA